jgi:predicted transcriptional regulator
MLIRPNNILVKITFELSDEIDEKFRKLVADTKGLHRGVMQEALEEAIQLWIAEQAKGKARSEKHRL